MGRSPAVRTCLRRLADQAGLHAASGDPCGGLRPGSRLSSRPDGAASGREKRRRGREGGEGVTGSRATPLKGTAPAGGLELCPWRLGAAEPEMRIAPFQMLGVRADLTFECSSTPPAWIMCGKDSVWKGRACI